MYKNLARMSSTAFKIGQNHFQAHIYMYIAIPKGLYAPPVMYARITHNQFHYHNYSSSSSSVNNLVPYRNKFASLFLTSNASRVIHGVHTCRFHEIKEGIYQQWGWGSIGECVEVNSAA